MEVNQTRCLANDIANAVGSCNAGHVSRIVLLSDFSRAFDEHADVRNVAMIRRRHEFWKHLSRVCTWNLGIRNARALEAASEDLRGSVCWIDLPMLPRDDYKTVFTRAAAASPATVLDHPDDIERVVGLECSYPVLVEAGIPTPRTAFLPIDDARAAAIDSPAAVRNSLTDAIYNALFDAGINPHDGVFVRGFYSSVKSANPEHYFGNNQTDIEATVFEVIRRLRVSLELGGLALREHLDLERIEIPGNAGARDNIRVPFEVRLTVLDGRLLMASYHGPFTVLADEPRRILENALADRRAIVECAVQSLAPLLLAANLPPNYVADIAFVRGGEPVVLELNPLYAAGYNVPAAHALVVTALGAHLAYRAGYPQLDWNEILDIAEALIGEHVEQCPAVWVYGMSPR